MSTLDIRNLTIEQIDGDQRFAMVERLSLNIAEGEIHALVGESGSGKSLVAKAIVGLLNEDWHIMADRMLYGGRDLLKMDPNEYRQLLGSEIAMIFQDPASCLDPIVKVSEQLFESLPLENFKGNFFKRREWMRQQAVSLLHQVGIQDHNRLMHAYPHELSDGLCQKLMIAMALAKRPKLLLADEPTTGMEPHTQGQLFRLLQRLNRLHNMSILLVSHDMGAATQLADRISMMYSGQIMESASKDKLVSEPWHPYTKALLESSPAMSSHIPHKAPLNELRGSVPSVRSLPIGCRLGPRCAYARRECVVPPKLVRSQGRCFRCHFPLKITEIKKPKEPV